MMPVRLAPALQAKVDAGNAVIAQRVKDGLMVTGSKKVPGVEEGPGVAPIETGFQSPQEQGGDPNQQSEPERREPEQPAPIEEPQAEDEGTFQQRYNTLKGKYDKEVPRLAGDLRRFETAVEGMQRQLGEAHQTINLLNARLLSDARSNAPSEPPKQKQRLITDAEINDYKDEFFDVVGRRAQEVVGEDLQAALTRIDHLENQLRTVSGKVGGLDQELAATVQDKYFSALTSAIPDWEQQNEDENFLQWLNSEEDYSGMPLQKVLANAAAVWDAPRVIRIFQGYRNPVTSASSAQNGSIPAPQRGNGRVNLETLAAPGRVRQSGVREPAAPAVVTSEDLRRLDQDISRGVYKNRPQELRAQRARIDAAFKAGKYERSAVPRRF